MAADEEPSAKKPRGMGAGTPSQTAPPAELSSQPAATVMNRQVEETPTTMAREATSPPSPATAGAAAATEEEIQAVLDQVEAGADWETASKRKGRPPKAPVMPHGALDKFVTVTQGTH
eukprot:2680516-Amphidinium_carterae.1